MIDFKNYKNIKLKDCAEFERAKKGKTYPAGTSTIQISATKGETGYLEEPSEVHGKNVAIIPNRGIDPRYFKFVIQKNMGQFLAKYATGLNIQEKESGNFPIQLHNMETQEAIAGMMEFVDAKTKIIEKEINVLMETKKKFLEEMLAYTE